MIRSNYSN